MDEGVKTTKTYISKRDLDLPEYLQNLIAVAPHNGEYIVNLSRRALYCRFQTICKKAGIQHYRFHDLRHTFATMALSSGVDVKTLSSMLGHYSAGFTLDTYTHITNDMQRGAAEKIGGFMESVTATTTPEPPDPPEESRCKVIPFEKVG